MEVDFLLNIFFNQQKITDFVEKEKFWFSQNHHNYFFKF